MTAQFQENLIFKGKKYGMASEPFNQYLSKNKLAIRFTNLCSALWRGYMGSWLIEDDMLFLTSISGRGLILNKEKYREGKLALRQKLKVGLITPSQNGHLLKALEEECFEEIELSLKSLFHTEEKVFASWFSGKLYVPYGMMLQYVHMGYESVYEKEMIFTITEGRVTGLEKRKNTISPRSLDFD
jgi:hypothetical protein